jgi:hypothetical protein
MVHGTALGRPTFSSAVETRSAPPELANNSPNMRPAPASTPTLASVSPKPDMETFQNLICRSAGQQTQGQRADHQGRKGMHSPSGNREHHRQDDDDRDGQQIEVVLATWNPPGFDSAGCSRPMPHASTSEVTALASLMSEAN